MRMKLAAISLVLVCSAFLLSLSVVPVAEAGTHYFEKTATFTLVREDIQNPDIKIVIMTAELEIHYYRILEYWDNYIYLKCDDTKVTYVKVTFDYCEPGTPYGYLQLDLISLATGKEPLDEPFEGGYVTHWMDDPWEYNERDEPPETYEANPYVRFETDCGQAGKYGIIEWYWSFWRLNADGNYLWVSFNLNDPLIGPWVNIQLAWQYYHNVLIGSGWYPA